MTTESRKLFLRMMTSLFQAQQSVDDLFFKNRLNEEIENIMERHIEHEAHQSQELRFEFIRSLKNMEKLLTEINYLGQSDTVELALAHEQLLRCLRDFLREIKNKDKTKTPINPGSAIKLPETVQVHRTSARPALNKGIQNGKKLTETQEKILEFVRREPDCRTKDVVNQFSALSERTVKRGLKELSEEGKVIKRSDGAAVYYSAV